MATGAGPSRAASSVADFGADAWDEWSETASNHSFDSVAPLQGTPEDLDVSLLCAHNNGADFMDFAPPLADPQGTYASDAKYL